MRQELSPDRIAEYLRMALPAMAKNGVPATPRNYAVWFEYAAGLNQELVDQINGLCRLTDAFNETVNEELYHKFVSKCEHEKFEKERADMISVLREIGQVMSEARHNVDAYHDDLQQVSAEFEHCNNLDGIRGLLRNLKAKTQSMQSATRGINDHIHQKSAEIEALQDELHRVRQKAITDPLTGIPNREALFDAIQASIGREEQPLSLVMTDIDHFKQFNDNFGHIIGDRVIKFVASILTKYTRGGDIATRFGGEEFAVLLPNTSLSGAQSVAENLRRAVSEAKLVRTDTKTSLGQVTISAGISAFRPGEEITDFLDRADRALYASKHNGRNKVTSEIELTSRIAS